MTTQALLNTLSSEGSFGQLTSRSVGLNKATMNSELNFLSTPSSSSAYTLSAPSERFFISFDYSNWVQK